MGRRRVLQADEDQDPNSEEYGFNLPLHIKISRATDWTKYLGPLNPEIIKQDPKAWSILQGMSIIAVNDEFVSDTRIIGSVRNPKKKASSKLPPLVRTSKNHTVFAHLDLFELANITLGLGLDSTTSLTERPSPEHPLAEVPLVKKLFDPLTPLPSGSVLPATLIQHVTLPPVAHVLDPKDELKNLGVHGWFMLVHLISLTRAYMAAGYDGLYLVGHAAPFVPTVDPTAIKPKRVAILNGQDLMENDDEDNPMANLLDPTASSSSLNSHTSNSSSATAKKNTGKHNGANVHYAAMDIEVGTPEWAEFVSTRRSMVANVMAAYEKYIAALATVEPWEDEPIGDAETDDPHGDNDAIALVPLNWGLILEGNPDIFDAAPTAWSAGVVTNATLKPDGAPQHFFGPAADVIKGLLASHNEQKENRPFRTLALEAMAGLDILSGSVHRFVQWVKDNAFLGSLAIDPEFTSLANVFPFPKSATAPVDYLRAERVIAFRKLYDSSTLNCDNGDGIVDSALVNAANNEEAFNDLVEEALSKIPPADIKVPLKVAAALVPLVIDQVTAWSQAAKAGGEPPSTAAHLIRAQSQSSSGFLDADGAYCVPRPSNHQASKSAHWLAYTYLHSLYTAIAKEDPAYAAVAHIFHQMAEFEANGNHDHLIPPLMSNFPPGVTPRPGADVSGGDIEEGAGSKSVVDIGIDASDDDMWLAGESNRLSAVSSVQETGIMSGQRHFGVDYDGKEFRRVVDVQSELRAKGMLTNLSMPVEREVFSGDPRTNPVEPLPAARFSKMLEAFDKVIKDPDSVGHILEAFKDFKHQSLAEISVMTHLRELRVKLTREYISMGGIKSEGKNKRFEVQIWGSDKIGLKFASKGNDAFSFRAVGEIVDGIFHIYTDRFHPNLAEAVLHVYMNSKGFSNAQCVLLECMVSSAVAKKRNALISDRMDDELTNMSARARAGMVQRTQTMIDRNRTRPLPLAQRRLLCRMARAVAATAKRQLLREVTDKQLQKDQLLDDLEDTFSFVTGNDEPVSQNYLTALQELTLRSTVFLEELQQSGGMLNALSQVIKALEGTRGSALSAFNATMMRLLRSASMNQLELACRDFNPYLVRESDLPIVYCEFLGLKDEEAQSYFGITKYAVGEMLYDRIRTKMFVENPAPENFVKAAPVYESGPGEGDPLSWKMYFWKYLEGLFFMFPTSGNLFLFLATGYGVFTSAGLADDHKTLITYALLCSFVITGGVNNCVARLGSMYSFSWSHWLVLVAYGKLMAAGVILTVLVVAIGVIRILVAGSPPSHAFIFGAYCLLFSLFQMLAAALFNSHQGNIYKSPEGRAILIALGAATAIVYLSFVTLPPLFTGQLLWTPELMATYGVYVHLVGLFVAVAVVLYGYFTLIHDRTVFTDKIFPTQEDKIVEWYCKAHKIKVPPPATGGEQALVQWYKDAYEEDVAAYARLYEVLELAKRARQNLVYQGRLEFGKTVTSLAGMTKSRRKVAVAAAAAHMALPDSRANSYPNEDWMLHWYVLLSSKTRPVPMTREWDALLKEARAAMSLKRKTDALHRGGLLWEVVRPFFGHGVFYYLLVFVDRLVQLSVGQVVALFSGTNNYEIAMGWALLFLLLTSGALEPLVFRVKAIRDDGTTGKPRLSATGRDSFEALAVPEIRADQKMYFTEVRRVLGVAALSWIVCAIGMFLFGTTFGLYDPTEPFLWLLYTIGSTGYLFFALAGFNMIMLGIGAYTNAALSLGGSVVLGYVIGAILLYTFPNESWVIIFSQLIASMSYFFATFNLVGVTRSASVQPGEMVIAPATMERITTSGQRWIAKTQASEKNELKLILYLQGLTGTLGVSPSSQIGVEVTRLLTRAQGSLEAADEESTIFTAFPMAYENLQTIFSLWAEGGIQLVLVDEKDLQVSSILTYAAISIVDEEAQDGQAEMIIWVGANENQSIEVIAQLCASALLHEAYENLLGYSHRVATASELLISQDFEVTPRRIERQFKGSTNSELEAMVNATEEVVLDAMLLGVDIDRDWVNLPPLVRYFIVKVLEVVQPGFSGRKYKELFAIFGLDQEATASEIAEWILSPEEFAETVAEASGLEGFGGPMDDADEGGDGGLGDSMTAQLPRADSNTSLAAAKPGALFRADSGLSRKSSRSSFGGGNMQGDAGAGIEFNTHTPAWEKLATIVARAQLLAGLAVGVKMRASAVSTARSLQYAERMEPVGGEAAFNDQTALTLEQRMHAFNDDPYDDLFADILTMGERPPWHVRMLVPWDGLCRVVYLAMTADDSFHQELTWYINESGFAWPLRYVLAPPWAVIHNLGRHFSHALVWFPVLYRRAEIKKLNMIVTQGLNRTLYFRESKQRAVVSHDPEAPSTAFMDYHPHPLKLVDMDGTTVDIVDAAVDDQPEGITAEQVEAAKKAAEEQKVAERERRKEAALKMGQKYRESARPAVDGLSNVLIYDGEYQNKPTNEKLLKGEVRYEDGRMVRKYTKTGEFWETGFFRYPGDLDELDERVLFSEPGFLTRMEEGTNSLTSISVSLNQTRLTTSQRARPGSRGGTAAGARGATAPGGPRGATATGLRPGARPSTAAENTRKQKELEARQKAMERMRNTAETRGAGLEEAEDLERVGTMHKRPSGREWIPVVQVIYEDRLEDDPAREAILKRNKMHAEDSAEDGAKGKDALESIGEDEELPAPHEPEKLPAEYPWVRRLYYDSGGRIVRALHRKHVPSSYKELFGAAMGLGDGGAVSGGTGGAMLASKSFPETVILDVTHRYEEKHSELAPVLKTTHYRGIPGPKGEVRFTVEWHPYSYAVAGARWYEDNQELHNEFTYRHTSHPEIRSYELVPGDDGEMIRRSHVTPRVIQDDPFKLLTRMSTLTVFDEDYAGRIPSKAKPGWGVQLWNWIQKKRGQDVEEQVLLGTLPPNQARLYLWSMWNQDRLEGCLARLFDEWVLRHQAPGLKKYWFYRNIGMVSRARKSLIKDQDSIQNSIHVPQTGKLKAYFSIRVQDLVIMGTGGSEHSNLKTVVAKYNIATEGVASIEKRDEKKLHVVGVDSGTWPADGGGVASCRRDLVDRLKRVRWSLRSEIGNPAKVMHYQTEKNVDSLLLQPLWGTELGGPKEAVLSHRPWGELAVKTWETTDQVVRQYFVPMLCQLILAFNNPQPRTDDLEKYASLLVNMYSYFQRYDWTRTWNHKEVWFAWRSLWCELENQRAETEYVLDTEMPNLRDLDDALQLLVHLLIPITVPVEDDASVVQATHHGVQAFHGVIAKKVAAASFEIWDHGMTWRERCRALSEMDFVNIFPRNVMIGMTRVAALVCYHMADAVVSCAATANVPWQLRLGGLNGDTLMTATMLRKTSPVVNGVETDKFFPNRDLEEERPTAIMLSHVFELKDIKNAIRAAAVIVNQYKQSDFHLLIYGSLDKSTSYTAECREIIAAEGIANNVTLAGLGRSAQVLPRGWVFVNSSQSEGLPLALGEAGCAGLPVVCTDVGGSIEMAFDGQHTFGNVVPPRSGLLLAKGILRTMAMLDGLEETASLTGESTGESRGVDLFEPVELGERIKAVKKQRQQLGMRFRSYILNDFALPRYLREHEEMINIMAVHARERCVQVQAVNEGYIMPIPQKDVSRHIQYLSVTDLSEAESGKLLDLYVPGNAKSKELTQMSVLEWEVQRLQYELMNSRNMASLLSSGETDPEKLLAQMKASGIDVDGDKGAEAAPVLPPIGGAGAAPAAEPGASPVKGGSGNPVASIVIDGPDGEPVEDGDEVGISVVPGGASPLRGGASLSPRPQLAPLSGGALAPGGVSFVPGASPQKKLGQLSPMSLGQRTSGDDEDLIGVGGDSGAADEGTQMKLRALAQATLAARKMAANANVPLTGGPPAGVRGAQTNLEAGRGAKRGRLELVRGSKGPETMNRPKAPGGGLQLRKLTTLGRSQVKLPTADSDTTRRTSVAAQAEKENSLLAVGGGGGGDGEGSRLVDRRLSAVGTGRKLSLRPGLGGTGRRMSIATGKPILGLKNGAQENVTGGGSPLGEQVGAAGNSSAVAQLGVGPSRPGGSRLAMLGRGRGRGDVGHNQRRNLVAGAMNGGTAGVVAGAVASARRGRKLSVAPGAAMPRRMSLAPGGVGAAGLRNRPQLSRLSKQGDVKPLGLHRKGTLDRSGSVASIMSRTSVIPREEDLPPVSEGMENPLLSKMRGQAREESPGGLLKRVTSKIMTENSSPLARSGSTASLRSAGSSGSSGSNADGLTARIVAKTARHPTAAAAQANAARVMRGSGMSRSGSGMIGLRQGRMVGLPGSSTHLSGQERKPALGTSSGPDGMGLGQSEPILRSESAILRGGHHGSLVRQDSSASVTRSMAEAHGSLVARSTISGSSGGSGGNKGLLASAEAASKSGGLAVPKEGGGDGGDGGEERGASRASARSGGSGSRVQLPMQTGSGLQGPGAGRLANRVGLPSLNRAEGLKKSGLRGLKKSSGPGLPPSLAAKSPVPPCDPPVAPSAAGAEEVEVEGDAKE